MCGLALVTEESESVLLSHAEVIDNFDKSCSESDEEEELEVQYWRKERHFRGLYLESVQVGFFTTIGYRKHIIIAFIIHRKALI